MEQVEEAEPNYVLALGGVPEVYFGEAVERCILTLGTRPQTIMEIVVMSHFNTYLRSVDPRMQPHFFMPQNMLPHGYFFMAGYKFIEFLYEELQNPSPPGTLEAASEAVAALVD